MWSALGEAARSRTVPSPETLFDRDPRLDGYPTMMPEPCHCGHDCCLGPNRYVCTMHGVTHPEDAYLLGPVACVGCGE